MRQEKTPKYASVFAIIVPNLKFFPKAAKCPNGFPS